MSDLSRRFYFLQRGQNRLFEVVSLAVEEESRKSGLRQKDMAERIGVSSSQISRWLSGPANWTVDTFNDLLYAIGAEMDYKVVKFSDREKENRYHPMNDRVAVIGAHQLQVPNPTEFQVSGTHITTQTGVTAKVTIHGS